jgi:hypothetical protein
MHEAQQEIRDELSRQAASTDVDTMAVRQWAGESGYNISACGRIHGDVVEAYRGAQR